jgi:hypothetical protein
MIPDRRQFEDDVLGPRSSLPKWQSRRAVKHILLSLAPIAVIVLGTACSLALSGPGFRAIFCNRYVLALVLLASSFSLGLTLTLGLCARWSQLQQSTQTIATPDRRLLGDPGVLWYSVVFMALATVLAPYVPGLGWARLPLSFLAVLPLFIAIAALGWVGQRPSSEAEGPQKRHKVLLLLLLLLVSLVALTAIHDVAEAVAASRIAQWCQGVIPWYARLGRPFLGAVALLPVCLLIYTLYRLWTFTENKDKRDGEEPEEEEEEEEDTPDEGGEPPLPEWAEPISIVLSAFCRPEISYFAPDETSPEAGAGGEGLSPYFGHEPTRDQSTAFGHYRRLALETMGCSGETVPSTGDGARRSHDLLVHGPMNSGKTSLGLACALHSAFETGRRSLILTQSDAAARALERQLGARIEAILPGFYCPVALLTGANVDQWLASDEAIFPMVVVGTLPAVEQLLYGAEHAGGAETENRLGRIVEALELLVVDELTAFGPPEAAHFPFFMDKHRLVLESRGRSMQAVILSSPLPGIAADYVGRRVFAGAHAWERNVHSLAPVPARKPRWVVETRVSASHMDDLYQVLLDELAEAKMGTALLLPPGSSEEAGKAVLDRFPGAPFQIIQTTEELGVTDGDAVAAIVCHDAAPELCQCLCSTVPGEAAVLFNLIIESARSGGGDSVPGDEPSAIPAMAQSTATPLRTLHLRSAMRFIDTRSPIREEVWGAFASDWRSFASVDGGPVDAPTHCVDMDDDLSDAYPEYLRKQPGVAYVPASFVRKGVDVALVPSTVEQLAKSAGDAVWRLLLCTPSQRHISTIPATSRAEWRTPSGECLAELDLARMTELRVVRGGDTYIPGRVERVDEIVRIGARHCDAQAPTQFSVPIANLSWKTPVRQVFRTDGIDVDDAICWFSLDDEQDRSPVCVRTDGTLHTLFCAKSGRQRNLPQIVKYSYAACPAGFVLDPNPLTGVPDLEHHVGRALGRQWETDPAGGYNVALSAALNHAFAERVPSLWFYASLLAFSLPDNSALIGNHIVWVLEPWSTAGSGYELVRSLLADQNERRDVIARAVHYLQLLGELPNQADRLHAALRDVGFCKTCSGAITDEAIRQAQELLQRLIDCCDGVPVRRVRVLPTCLPVGPTVEPEPAPYNPPWDEDGDVATWQECLEQLWHQALRAEPRLGTTTASSWPLRLSLLLQADTSGLTRELHNAFAVTTPGGAGQPQMYGDTLRLPFRDSAMGDEMLAELERWLPEAFAALSGESLVGHTLRLSLWGVGCDGGMPESDERLPDPDDPIHVILVGGITPSGLLKVRKVTEEETVPSPLPIEPQPGLLPGEMFPVAPPLGSKVCEPVWQAVDLTAPILSPKPSPGLHRLAWSFEGRESALYWGFRNEGGEGTLFLDLLQRQQYRFSTQWFCPYIHNDPHLPRITELEKLLARVYGRQRDGRYAEFLLTFVQMLPYVPDPKLMTDCPRFPTEYFGLNGGDCEDSSIALAALLACAGIPFAFLNYPGHIAIGVEGAHQGVYYEGDGHRYYYAETACDGFPHPLGTDGALATSCTLSRYPYRGVGSPMPICILAGHPEHGPKTQYHCLLAVREALPADHFALALFVSRGEAQKPPQAGEMVLANAVTVSGARAGGYTEVSIPWRHPGGTGTFTCHLVAYCDGQVVGRWPCASQYHCS